MPLKSFALLVLVCLVWALNVIVSKLAVGPLALPPVFYAGVRSALVAAALAPWLFPVPRPFWKLIAVALAVGGGAFALLFVGLETASPSSAAIVSLLGAPAAVVFAILMLGEKVGWRRAVGIALTIAGAGIVLFDPQGIAPSRGLGFVALSAVVGGFGAVLLKTLVAEPLRLQAWSGLAGTALLLPLSMLIETGQAAAAAEAGWRFAAVIAFSALIVSIGAHTVYFHLLQRHDVNLISPLTLMTPFFTIVLGVLLTGDRVGPALLGGGLLAAAGVLVIVVRPSKKVPKDMLVRPRL